MKPAKIESLSYEILNWEEIRERAFEARESAFQLEENTGIVADVCDMILRTLIDV